MGVFDTSTPAGTDPKSQGDDRIREFKSAVQEALRGGATEGDEAIFPGPSPLTAPIFRYRGLKGSTASRPAAAVGGLYHNTDTGTLQRSNGVTWDDLTENAAYEAIHQAVAASLASVTGVATLPETGNSFNVTGSEAMTAIQGWSAGIVIIKWVSSRTLTHSSSFYLRNAQTRVVAANEISVFEFTGSNSVREVASNGGTLPTRQTFLSGSGTYTTPTGARQLRVRVVGGGGGGGSCATSGTSNDGAAGSDSSFNSVVAKGGSGGKKDASGVGGIGGTGGSGSATLRMDGAAGGCGGNGTGATTGGNGGGSAFFGGGGRGSNAADGLAAGTNSGGGGGAGGLVSYGAGAGGAGESFELIINSPSATYSYAVGAGGAGGVASTDKNGGAGAAGIVIVDEIY